MSEPAEGAGSGGGQTTSMGIDPHLAGLLAYLLGVVSGLVVFLVEKDHQEVRYHGAQSTVVFGALLVAGIVVSTVAAIPLIGWIIALVATPVLSLGGLVLWIYLMIQGYQLNHVRLPIAGRVAEQWTQQ